MAKYTPQQVADLARPIASKIDEAIQNGGEATSVAVATEQMTREGAPSLSLGTMSAVTVIASYVVNIAGNEAASGAMGAIARQLAGVNIFVEFLDLEFDWDDVAALSTAVGANLLSNPSPDPVTKKLGIAFLFYGETIPFWNWIGFTFGANLLRNWDPLGLYDDINTNYNQSKNWMPPRTDPLVLDLDNDGIETIGIGNTVVVFDHDGDGIRTGTGWVKSDDGFLVLDRNENGTIDTGAELFGVDTVKTSGALATDGFDALGDLDSNADGVFGASDEAFALVQVWRDFNQNGISAANELFSLAELGIVSIDLNATKQNVNFGNGNVQTAAAAHLTVDGEGQTGNLDLANNSFYREFTISIPLTEEAKNLPDSKASGLVRDLREAVSLSPALASVLTNYASQSSLAGQRALLDDLLSAWAQTSTMKTSIEQAADQNFLLLYLVPGQSWSDHDAHLAYWNTTDTAFLDSLSAEARTEYQQMLQQQQEIVEIISILERFNGTPFVTVDADKVTLGNGFSNTVNPVPGMLGTKRFYVTLSTQQIEFMQQSYELLKESVYGSLILQTRLSPYLDEIALKVNESSEVYVDFSAMDALLDSQKAADPAAALADLIELNKYAGEILQDKGWNGLDLLRDWIDADAAGEQSSAILQDLGVSIIWHNHMTSANDDIVFSEPGDASISGFIGNDILNGGAGNDNLSGSSGDDILFGGDGRDLLVGGDGDDILRGGGGKNDHLRGDRGNDTYLFAPGDGDISINNNYGDDNHDVLRFLGGITPENVSAARNLNSLDLIVETTGEIVSIFNYFYGDLAGTYVLDTIEFRDGTSWDISTIRSLVIESTTGDDNLTGFETDDIIDGLAGDDIIAGASGNDNLSGGDGNDSLTGGEGNDVLSGGAGNDGLYGADGSDNLDGGDGTDMLFGGAGDDILRGGTGANDHLRGDVGNDTYLYAAGDGNTAINNHDKGDSHDVLRFMEGITPADVTVSRDTYSLLLTILTTGERITVTNYFYLDTNSSYMLDAIEFSDGTSWDSSTVKQLALTGTDGNDTMYGFTSDDIINGLGGEDTINGGEGNDTIYGGLGNDYLYGVGGNDTLLGGDGSDSVHGGMGDDTLSGGAGSNDILSGDEGNDIYLFSAGDGNTTISNYNTDTNSNDVLRFGTDINPDDVLVSRVGQNLYLTVLSTGEIITVQYHFYGDQYKLNSVEFIDATSWDTEVLAFLVLTGTEGADYITGFATDDTINGLDGNDILRGDGGNDVINGGDGADQVYGGAGDDTLSGNSGSNDTLDGGAGNDVYLFAAGDGKTTVNNYDTGASRHDVLRFDTGIGPGIVLVSRFGNDLKLSVESTSEIITVKNHFIAGNQYMLNAVEFADGTSWDSTALALMALMGTEGNDSIIGFVSDDTINGLGGNDTLYGGDGNDVIDGGDGADRLYGNSGDDILSGGSGSNDSLDGGAGNDTYLFAAGDGNTMISNYDTGANSQDILRFDSGISPDDILATRTGSYDLALTLQSTGEKITVSYFFYLDTAHPSYRLDVIEFADGTSWNPDAVMQKVLQGTDGVDVINGSADEDTIDGLGGNDTIYGKSGNDTLYGGTGDDYLNGYDGNDMLEGGEGADRLYGSSGDDILSGGTGSNDTLDGGAGNDTYVFAMGDGIDSISNYDANALSIDVLQFVNISYENLWFSRSSNDLKINVVGTNDQITISNWYFNNSYKLDQIYAGSASLSNEEVDQLVSAMSSYSAPSGEDAVISQDVMEILQSVFTELWL